MKFQIKAIIIILGILVVTLILNSILSLASFEQFYTGSLISTYGLAGKNLKRYVEQSLRFGKPLESFEGMEDLLGKVAQDNPEISGVGVGTPQGEILYHTDAKMLGMLFPAKVPPFKGPDAVEALRLDGMYLMYVPIHDRSKNLVGVVGLSFSRDVIYRKLKDMALDNLKVLWTLMILVSMGFILVMSFLITRPLRHRIAAVTSLLEWERGEGCERREESRALADAGGQPISTPSPASVPVSAGLLQMGHLDINKIHDEVAQLEWHIVGFVKHSLQMLELKGGLEQDCNEVSAHLEKLEALADELGCALESPGLAIEEPMRADLADLLEESRSAIGALRGIVRSARGTGI